jgi:alkylated DNA repair dioxygenase AlkB
MSATTVPDGLYYYPDFLTSEEQELLLDSFQSDGWDGVTSSDTSRRVRHYGWEYPYTGGALVETDPIPDEYEFFMDRLSDYDCLSDFSPDQLIINRYLPRQGISAHIDSTRLFGPIIACITIGSGAEMEFTRSGHPSYTIYTEPGSLYVMSGEARTLWRHQMRSRLTDPDPEGSGRVTRGTRYSLTFREVL